ncbi:MAG: OmpA/MotB family protein [Planctomycetota bacterium]|jgi:outer membrane protein OmpA-like peptidoglycan-associated protein
MKHLGRSGLIAVVPMICLAMLGCNDQYKREVMALRSQYNDLSRQNQDLRNQLSQSKTREAELLSQLDTKDSQLSSRMQEAMHLKAQLSEKPEPTVIVEQPTKSGSWDVGRYADRVTVGSDILFAAGRASITAKGKKALNKIVRDIKNKYPHQLVRVYGYTDSDPIKRTKKLWKDNLDLSANRAMAVTRYLRDKGINAENVETIAMGATNFVAKNNTSANKAKNRRVEIVVIKD